MLSLATSASGPSARACVSMGERGDCALKRAQGSACVLVNGREGGLCAEEGFEGPGAFSPPLILSSLSLSPHTHTHTHTR